jgi:hypothetical protein
MTSDNKWSTDRLERLGKVLLVFYFGTEVRGSITCESEDEAKLWESLTSRANESKS